METIFRLGEQKLNNFLVREAEIDEKQSRQSNSKNFMQYVFFKVYSSVQWGLEQRLRRWEFSRTFVSKVTVQCVRLLLTVSYRKIGGAVCTSCSPNNSVGGAT